MKPIFLEDQHLDFYPDPNMDGVLTELSSQPEIVLHPPFNSDVFIYQSTVPFDATILQLWGKASKCHLAVRIDTKSEDNRFVNMCHSNDLILWIENYLGSVL